MIRPLLFSALLSVLAGPVLALSCVPHDLARSFAEAAEAEEVYIIVHGTLTFDASLLPKVDYDRQDETPPDTLIPARLAGKFLSLQGFDTPFDQPITLNAQCFGPWCAGAATDTPYLGFLQQTPTGYLLAVTPCGGFGFANPTPEMLEKATQCIRGETCEPDPF